MALFRCCSYVAGDAFTKECHLFRRTYLLLILLFTLLAACGGPQVASTPAGGNAPTGVTPTVAVAGASPTAEAAQVTATVPVAVETAAPLQPTEALMEASPTGALDGGTATPAAETSYPLSYTDATGAKVTLEQQPERIVSLFPINNETLFAIGAGEQVVAVDEAFTRFPEEATEKQTIAGDYQKFDIEKIVSLKPDLVLSAGGAEKIVDEPLKDAGVRVINIGYPASLADTLKLMRDLGKITGNPDEADKLATELEASIEEVRRQTADAKKPRVYLETDISTPGKPYVAGGGSLGDELITIAGGKNIFANADPFAQVGYEAIVKANPEVILLANAKGFVGPNFLNPTTPAEVKKRKGFASTSAVKNNRVVPINAEVLSTPGPRLIRGVRELATAIHPEIFGER